MKVSSFLPAVTQMIYDMGLDGYLDGITFECPKIALDEKQKAVRYKLEGKQLTSAEINEVFSKSKASGESLYYVDEPILESILPDIIFTQDVCEVCQIDTECTSKAVANLSKQPEIIAISPDSLQDVFDSAITIAKAMKQEEKAYAYLSKLQARIDAVIDTQRKHKLVPKSVLLLEWIDPLFNCGHWIPHQIGLAGGIDLLSHPSGDSIVIPFEKIVKYNPEVIIIAPCGYNVETTIKDMQFLEANPQWKSLKAVQNNAVFIADFDMFTQPSASTLVNGIECLSAMIHPDYFSVNEGLKNRFMNYSQKAYSTN